MPTLPPYACLPQVGLSYYRHGKCSGGGGGLPPWVPPALCVGKGALPVVHLAHWAEFWAKKRPRKIILGQNVWANFSGPRCRRGGHPVVPSGPAGCRGVWGRWPVGYLHELAPGSGCRWVVPKPNKSRRTPNPFCSADKGQMIRESHWPVQPTSPARCCRRCAAQPLALHRFGHE
jgi:hypothetical protein